MIGIGDCVRLIKRIERLEKKSRPKYKAPPFSMFYESRENLEAWHKKNNPNLPLPRFSVLDDFYN